MLLVAGGAAGLQALSTQRKLRDAQQRLADTSAEWANTSAELEASRADLAAKQAQAAALRAELDSAERREMQRAGESEKLAASLKEVQRDPTRWLLHEEQQLVRELRELQAKREPAAAAAKRRDLLKAKGRDVRQRFLERLDMRFNFFYSGGLDEVVKYLSEQTKVPIAIQADDLAEAQIPGFAARRCTATTPPWSKRYRRQSFAPTRTSSAPCKTRVWNWSTY
jgi:hypothetical protein